MGVEKVKFTVKDHTIDVERPGCTVSNNMDIYLFRPGHPAYADLEGCKLKDIVYFVDEAKGSKKTELEYLTKARGVHFLRDVIPHEDEVSEAVEVVSVGAAPVGAVGVESVEKKTFESSICRRGAMRIPVYEKAVIRYQKVQYRTLMLNLSYGGAQFLIEGDTYIPEIADFELLLLGGEKLNPFIKFETVNYRIGDRLIGAKVTRVSEPAWGKIVHVYVSHEERKRERDKYLKEVDELKETKRKLLADIKDLEKQKSSLSKKF